MTTGEDIEDYMIKKSTGDVKVTTTDKEEKQRKVYIIMEGDKHEGYGAIRFASLDKKKAEVILKERKSELMEWSDNFYDIEEIELDDPECWAGHG